MVGTSGQGQAPTQANETTTSAPEHARAIERLVDQTLSQDGRSLTIDRATLQQIRLHAAAIASGGAKGRR